VKASALVLAELQAAGAEAAFRREAAQKRELINEQSAAFRRPNLLASLMRDGDGRQGR